MNKQCFRVIFSKTLQRLVVVSELAKSEGKSTERNDFSISHVVAQLKPLTFSLFCALGFVAFSDSALAETLIIQADKSAPKNQQPIVLQTANGLPQVNIQTPNDKGLSHNKYSQFDVAEKGAILNNSRTNTQTQQAGLIQGNPYLARGEAKVILNEVNSNKPSVMKGYVEVAGKKADVIIANPSGLHCEGCGIINSDRATFTTGKPEIKNGQVDNIKVEAGKVKVSGKGLDNSRVDYTEIIARETEVNAGIWSKKETKVITGKNTVKRSETDNNLQIIHTNQPLAGEAKPQVAIDVSELGGMYSGKIHLIGTENGVGVRNAGHIGASADTLQLDSQGRIVNTGTLNAAKPVTLTASNGIENKGKIENKQGDIQLKSQADIQNSGSIVARNGNIQKNANAQIQQSGETVAKGNITYRASTIHTTKDSLIAAGVEVTDTAQGETRKLEEKSENGKTVQLNSSSKTTAQGKNIASGKITISASEIDANLSQNNAHTIEYTAKSGDIQADNARLTAEQIHLTTPNLLSTQGSFLTAEVINTSQKSLNAQNAVWKQMGEQDFHLTGENINTQGGEFSTQGNFFINAKQLENQQGTLSSGKSLSLDLTGYLNSTDGKLFAGENLTLNSQNLNNDNGLIYAKQKIGITVKNGLVSNKNTDSTYKGIIAGKELLLESQTLDNTKGQITSEHIGLTTSQINNVEGAIRAEHNADINADTLFNHKGIVSSVQNANLTVSEISQQKGIIEAQHLQLNSNTLTSTENSLIFAEQLNLTTKGELNNQDSRIVAKKGAYLTTGSNVTNIRGVIGSQTADLQLNTHNHQINNTEGKIVAAQKLNVQSGSLSNEQGLITANNISLDTNNRTLNNQNTLTSQKDKGIIAQQNLVLNTKMLDNRMGNIIGFNNAQINTSEIINNSGQIRISGDLDIQSKSLSQQNGLITAGKATLTLSELNSNQNSEISANEITLNADKVANQNSRLQADKSFTLEAKQGITNHNGIIASKTDSLTINTHQSTLDNANGTLFANQALNIQSGKLDNRAGLISAKQTEINTQQNHIDNRNTQAENKGIIGLDKLSLNHLSLLNNEKGFIHSNKQLAVSATSHINNQQGILNSKENLTLNATQIDNKAGTISAKTAEVNAKSIDNNAVSNVGSLILGTTQLVLNTEQLANQNTKRKNTDRAPIQGIQAGQLTLNSNTLSNQQGGIYVADVATITVNQALNNLQGELLSDNELTIKEGGNLSLNNQEGLIQAKNRINLSAKTLEQEGTIKTQGDLTVRLKDSFTLNKAFEVGNDLDFSTQGDFTNNVALLIGNSATLSANQIVNAASGEISSKNSKLTAKEITNRGLIDGEKTLLNASKITNIGTGRIYGNYLSLKARNINNLAETIDGKTSSATIAARERLDFGVGTLTNRDHSLILSLDTMAVGGDLDNDAKAIGKADFVDNGSATIEILGNVQLGIKEAINQDIHLKESFEDSEEKHLNYMREYTDANGKTTRTNWFRHGIDGIYHSYNGDRRGHTRFIFFDKNRQDPNAYSNGSQDFWFEQNYLRKTKTPTYYDASPAKFLVGGILSIDGEDKMLNKYSHILVGNMLTLNGKHFTENKDNKSLMGNGFSLVNQDLERKITHYDLGKEIIYKFERRPTKAGRWRHKNFREPMANREIDEYSYEDINFNLIQNIIGIKPQYSGNKISEKVEAQNVSLNTISITGSDTELNSSTVNIKLTPTINDQDKNTIVDSGQVVGKLDKTVDDFDANKLGELEMPTIKTHLADITLPQASLYKINPDAPNGYLVETDPKFTDRKQWLSSDYMFEQLRHNHDNVHKRLGDGFYEQRLINEQINQLTGRRYIEGYSNDLEQYKALMNNGVKYAKEFNLAVGVGLTAKQMSELTTDMVWLVNKEITLADGRKVTALVPQVYLVARNSDITSRGAVISANQIIGNVDNLQNSGVIAGLDLTRLHSNQLENRGTILGNTVDLSAKQNLINLGGKIEAVKDLSLYAGKHLEISSTLSSSQSADGNFARTVLDQLASVKVTGEGGRLTLHSDDNLTIKAANIESQGSLKATADKALSITTLNVSNKEHYNGNADNYYRLDQQGEIGSTLRGKDGVRLVGMENATLRQATVSSENGETFIGSRGNVRIESGEQSEQLASSSKGSSKGWFSKTTETRRHYHDTTENIGSEIDGNKVTLYSEAGKVDIHGSAVVADKQLLIDSKEGVNITAATNTHYAEDEHIKTKRGLMGTGGIGFSVGKKKEQVEQDHTQESAARSQVGSLSGDTIIRTDGHYQQTGSIVTSRDGDVDVTAKSANITAARSDYESNYKRTYEQKGVTIAVNIPVVQAVQNAINTVKEAQKLGESKNNRINAMAAANSAFEAMRLVDQALGIMKNAKEAQNMVQAANISVSITYGEQKSTQTQTTRGNTGQSSQVQAGGNVSIRAVGDGSNSDVTITGSDVMGKKGTLLKADDEVNILAFQQNHQERSENKSSGFNAGVAVSYGSNGLAFGVTAGGNYGKGYGNGDETTWLHSHIGSQTGLTQIESGGKTTVKGGQVRGNRVELSAENLNVESVQNTMSYESKQMNAEGQVTVGYGFSASGSYNQSKMKANSATVIEQSGIFAGDGGFDIQVDQHTDLKGAVVTSTASAEQEGKNHFSTNTLSHQDIQNHSSYSAKGFGLNGGFSVSGGEAPKEIGGVKLQQVGQNHKDGSSKVELGGVAGVASQGNWGIAKGLATAVLGQVRDSSSENGVTTSAINTANITIRDEAAQQQRTGKSAEHTIAGINRENIHQSVNKVDIDKVKSEFERDLKTATDFVKNVSEGGDQMYYNMEKNEDSIFSTQKEREDCNRADCLDYKADNSQFIQDLIYGKDILSEEQALALSRFSTAGMLNLDRADKVSSAILYDDKNLTSIDETAVIINRGSAGFVNEILFTGFERFRAWVDMPAIFGASNATRDKVQLLSKIDEYNAYALENGKRTIDLNSIAHSLGVSGDKNALNWARYLDKDFKNSRIQFTHLAGSYSSNEIDTEARKLFKDVQTKYIGVDNDPVYRGLPLLRSIGFGLIGNNDKPVKGNGIGMGVAHSQANQNIYNLNLVYGNDKKGTDEKNKAHNVLDKVYPHNRERIFNIIPYKDGSND